MTEHNPSEITDINDLLEYAVKEQGKYERAYSRCMECNHPTVQARYCEGRRDAMADTVALLRPFVASLPKRKSKSRNRDGMMSSVLEG
jgi:hypothetical protein